MDLHEDTVAGPKVSVLTSGQQKEVPFQLEAERWDPESTELQLGGNRRILRGSSVESVMKLSTASCARRRNSKVDAGIIGLESGHQS